MAGAGPTPLCLVYSPGVGLAVFCCSVGRKLLGVFCLHAGVQQWFAFPCLNTSNFTLSFPTGLDVQPCWQSACYLPLPLYKLKTSNDILADDIISSAFGKHLEEEDGLKQKCLIKIAISGNSGAEGLLV